MGQLSRRIDRAIRAIEQRRAMEQVPPVVVFVDEEWSEPEPPPIPLSERATALVEVGPGYSVLFINDWRDLPGPTLAGERPKVYGNLDLRL